MKRIEAGIRTIRRLSIRRGRILSVALGVALLALAVLLGACGEAGPVAGGSTTSSVPSASPPESSYPIAGSGRPQLVDLGSEGCVPCDMMASELEALRQQYKDSLDVVFVDVNKTEEGAALARQLGIMVIPTQIFLDPNGKELGRHEGYISKEDIIQVFKEYGYPLRRGFGSLNEDNGGGGASA
jgi:thioredoxin 1